MDNEKGLIYNSLSDVFKTSMIAYAEDVILDRALPRVEDGLKPVQRRILYAMYEMGLTPDKPHKKCAKIVGECLGKYHPHGDTSVYGALVHLAQDFNMRLPLIDGHGNFGTVDGDGAAAYRYTEARLKDLSLELLRDIDKDTVNFSLTFDDSSTEPDTLPGRFPNILVNGAMGIAVGLATNIPTHNLSEVVNGTIAYIDNPKITLKEMMKHIKGPDFPTGGFIIAGEELEEAYRTGKGKIKIRSRVTVENAQNDKKNIIISEIPYQVNKALLLKKIADLKEEKKAEILSGISDIVDESDRNGMRAVIKLKKEADADRIIAYLMKNTDLEVSYGINMVAIANGKPCQLGLIDIISYYVNYQREVIYRRSKFDLERAKERAHILEGLIIAVKNIDEVIKIIKGAENTTDARNKLKERFNLSEAQAQAILDLRLAKLTKLEVTKLEDELKELKKTIEYLTEICQSKTRQMEVVKEELKELNKKYGEGRRSRIIEGGTEITEEDFKEELTKADNFFAVLTQGGYFKKITEHSFKLNSGKIKDTIVKEDLIKLCVPIKGNQTLIVFTNLGNCAKINIANCGECRFSEKGKKFRDICPSIVSGEMPVAFFSVDEGKTLDGNLLFYTKDGLIKRTEWKEYNLSKDYFQAIKLKEKDVVLGVEQDIEETTIAYVTKNGMILNAEKTDIPLQGRISGGVKGIKLDDDDEIVFVSEIDEEGEIVVITEDGYYKKVVSGEFEPMTRYRKGVKIVTLSEKSKVVFAGYVKEPYSLAIADSFGIVFSVNTEDITIESRTSKGKTLKTVDKKRSPELVTKIY